MVCVQDKGKFTFLLDMISWPRLSKLNYIWNVNIDPVYKNMLYMVWTSNSLGLENRKESKEKRESKINEKRSFIQNHTLLTNEIMKYFYLSII